MKVNCTVRFNANVRSENIGTGGYTPSMGHCSTLSIEGEPFLVDDGDGNLNFPVDEFKVGASLETGTRGSKFSGVITSVARNETKYGPSISITAVGEFDGVQGSIMGGTSCHLGWEILAISRVSGRFGTFDIRGGADVMARYDAAKAAHRAKFYQWKSTGQAYPADIVVWTDYAKAIANKLGHRLGECSYDGSQTMVESRTTVSPAQWADNAEQWAEEADRKARLERARRLGSVPDNAKDVRFIEGKGRLRWEFVLA